MNGSTAFTTSQNVYVSHLHVFGSGWFPIKCIETFTSQWPAYMTTHKVKTPIAWWNIWDNRVFIAEFQYDLLTTRKRSSSICWCGEFAIANTLLDQQSGNTILLRGWWYKKGVRVNPLDKDKHKSTVKACERSMSSGKIVVQSRGLKLTSQNVDFEEAWIS
jgi:hypothetical protein